MTCDQYDLATAAQTLRLLFHDLEVAQHTHTIREARTMRPTPGPMSPTNDNILSLKIELTDRLKEMAGECMTHIGADTQAWPEPTTLCTWIRWHAGPISQLPVAADLLEELHDQAAEIRETLAKLPGTDNQDKRGKRDKIKTHLTHKYRHLMPRLDTH